MTKNNRWLLPEGVEEVLPSQAWAIQHYQQNALALYASWGYELVIPPLLEYTESLLLNDSQDMDLQTFKLVDQLSGRSLGIRADITPQTCRIDAHSFKQDGPTRLCYAGTVLHSVPKSQLASRTPIEVGAELFGESGLAGDLEAISLMLASIELAGVDAKAIHLDLGHVGIYRGLLSEANLSASEADALFDAFDRKAESEIAQILAAAQVEADLAQMILALVSLHGGIEVLSLAEQALASAPSSVKAALAELSEIAELLQAQAVEASLFFDLAELRGFAYHTGLVFAAYVDGLGHSVANGGRFDNMGEAFGRARPATGFSVNVKALLSLQDCVAQTTDLPILAPVLGAQKDAALRELIQSLRSNNERVVYALTAEQQPQAGQRQIVCENGQWQVVPFS